MKTFAEIDSDVRQFIASYLDYPPQKLEPSTHITNLTDDSIRLFELLLAFEEHYALQVTYEEVARLHTIGDISQYIHGRINTDTQA